MDPYKSLGISLNPDGSLDRSSIIPPQPLSFPDESSAGGAAGAAASNVLAISKDITLNSSHHTSLRLYLPNPPPPPTGGKLPLIIYIHGGGFIMGSVDVPTVHHSCVRMAAKIPALIVSLGYRLAPENRLPAAYDDAVDALLWARDQARSIETADPWLKDHVDFSSCFLMGTSAGANVAYHLGLRSLSLDLEPLKVAGLMLSQPYIGGAERTESEMRSTDDKSLPLAANDLMWELSLPIGADRDHEYCNPMPAIARAKGLPRCFVKGYVGDPLFDRMQAFAKALDGEGVSVTVMMEDEGFHGIDFVDADKAEALTAEFRSFVYSGGVDEAGGRRD